MSDEPRYTIGSDNVFADLGLPNPEEALLKAELAHAISLAIRERHLTQEQAAQLLGLDQPKVSAITRGRLSGFSVERLFRCLTGLDQDVNIIVEPKRDERGRIAIQISPQTRPRAADVRTSLTLCEFIGSDLIDDWADRRLEPEEAFEESEPLYAEAA